MTIRQVTLGCSALLGMGIVILDGKTALSGAAEGIGLCIQTVIPALFPFFLFSILLTSAFVGSEIRILRPLGALFPIPKGAESLLIAAFLGGYPVGAQSIAIAHHNGQLNKHDAERMLAFCSNAGPSFLFGIIGQMFYDRKIPWILWGIHIVSAWMVSCLLPHRQGTAKLGQAQVSVSQAMAGAVKTMAMVCGWVVLFRVILAFGYRWFLWLFPIEIQVTFSGILELTNGCCNLNQIGNPELRFVICSGILALGGVCVTLQTLSVTQGLSIHYYCLGKLMQCAFSLVLATAIVLQLWFLPVLTVLAFAIFSRKTKNFGSNPEKAVV